MDPKAYWVGFNLVKGIGAVRVRTLLDTFETLEEAWNAPLDQLRAAGIPARALESLLKIRQEGGLQKAWEAVQKSKVTVLTWEDEAYPRRLREIDQPPPVLYVRGAFEAEDEWPIAVVGTRNITTYGRQVTEELAAFLAFHQISVVSGLARGVDRIAHEAALKAGGRTIAVLGSGVDRIYPPEHTRLAEQMMSFGAVVSDYALGTEPESINFPPRNRIISGLSRAVVVVEAGETSGALITARFAAEQGREVFAVPGNIYAPQSKGSNRLIRDGAHPLLKFEDILDVLNLEKVQEYHSARLLLPSDPVEARLLQVLADEPQHVDEICQRSGLPIEQVSATLTVMELKGMVRQGGGMNFSIVRENSGDYRVDDNAE
ncbi:MAG TPA: DNA-processing protein DprA [Anaerolineaceae bacterium]